MNKMKWALLFFLFIPFAFAQEEPQIQTQNVAGPIYALTGQGGNIGVSAGEDGILIVDDQFAPLAPRIEAALQAIKPGPVKFLLNTHWHQDHTGGNEHFGKASTIIAHENVRKRLSADQFIAFFNKTVPAAAKGALPVITFEHGVSVHFNGEEIEVLHYPHGHTDGDSIVFFTGSNVVHMGDHFFNGTFPFVDLASGGSVQGMIRNVEAVLARVAPDAKIIPGHGPVGGTQDLILFLEMLKATSQVVAEQVAKEASVEQAVQNGLPAEWEAWGKGFMSTDKWIEILYLSLKQPEAGETA